MCAKAVRRAGWVAAVVLFSGVGAWAQEGGAAAEDAGAAAAAAEPTTAGALPTLTNSLGMTFVECPAGEFQMGSPNSDIGRYANEEPHTVRITKPFYLGVYEVTQQEYERVMGTNPSFFSAAGGGKERVMGLDTGRFPVDSVSWDDAVEFCRKLSELPEEKQAGRVYRLPTEAQWEYACRAGTTTPFHFGERAQSTQANFDGNYPYLTYDEVQKGTDPTPFKGPNLKRTTAVGSYAPNAWGLYDMHGNLWEWCADWFSPVYYRQSPVEDPPGPEAGTQRVARGGGWYYFAAGCRAAVRYERDPGRRQNTDGFRVVCEVGAGG